MFFKLSSVSINSIYGIVLTTSICAVHYQPLKADMTFDPGFRTGANADANVPYPEPGMSFAGMNLSGTIFTSLDLTDCDFSGCNL